MCLSPTYSYVTNLDEVFDLLYWGWEGLWTNELENSLVELLVAVSDDLVEMVRKWNSLLSLTGSASG